MNWKMAGNPLRQIHGMFAMIMNTTKSLTHICICSLWIVNVVLGNIHILFLGIDIVLVARYCFWQNILFIAIHIYIKTMYRA